MINCIMKRNQKNYVNHIHNGIIRSTLGTCNETNKYYDKRKYDNIEEWFR